MRGRAALILCVIAGCSRGTVWEQVQNPDFPALIEEVESCPDCCGGAFDVLWRVNIPREYRDRLLAIAAEKEDKGNQLAAFKLLSLMGDSRVTPYVKERLECDSKNKGFLEECLDSLEDTPRLRELLRLTSVGKDEERAGAFHGLHRIRSKKAVKHLIPYLDDRTVLCGRDFPVGGRHCDWALYVIESTVREKDYNQSKIYSLYLYSDDEIRKWKEWWERHKEDAEYQ